VPNQASARGMKRMSVLVYRKSPFQWGAFGDSKVDISSNGMTDSYDSDVAAYNAGTAGSSGGVGSNGNINLSDSALIHGDAGAGGTVSNPTTHVTGTATTGMPPVTLSEVSCPAGGYTASVPSGTGISYDAGTGDLTVSGGNNITLSAPATYYFHNLTLSGGSTLTLGAGGHVDIYISRKLDLSGGGIINTGALPTSLSIWGCGTETSDWSLSGGTGSYFAVYAPHHKCPISGAGDIWGSIIGKEVTSSGGSKIHYDEALTRQPGIGKYMVVPRSWTELSP
jgi:hypothetical protein